METPMADQTMPAQQQDRQPGHEHAMDPAPDYAPRFPGSGRLDGKVAIVTGGDSGIGRASAVLFAREGASVAILYKDEHADAEETIRLIEAEGAEGLALAGDVGDKSVCEQAVDQVLQAFDRLDVLVNNAAEQHAQSELTDISEEQLKRTFATNIFGQFYMTQAALPHLGEGSAIVNVTSVTAFRGQDLLVDYASTKGAILAFTRALSGQLVDRGIRVNAVAPGPIWTPLIPASFPRDKVASFGGSAPMGRPGQPNEVAPAILFLACADSSYMTGQTLHPNGGDLVGG
jgi:NAD(P)-dependent dehydrogenase (short-subunit alcohol dehydrogenase family)